MELDFMADLRVDFNCPNNLCNRKYNLTLHTTGTEKPSSEGGTLIFRCANPNCKAMIQTIFIGEENIEVKWLEEPK